MRVFVAGAGGVVGSRLLPLLVSAGHDVVGTTTSPEKTERLRALGASPVVVDLLDREAVRAAVEAALPDVVVHQATALSSLGSPRQFDRGFALTNRLRTEGIDNLLAAGTAYVVAQSYAGWPYARQGGPVKTEEDPLDPAPARAMRETVAAMHHLDGAVLDAGGTVLRYGAFYGPGTSLGPGGMHLESVRKRKFPIVGDGGGVWSFAHIDDAASATLFAIESGATGVYNVCDDEPARVDEWLPALAEAIGAPSPRRVPAWLGRLAAGEAGMVLMTTSRGASNAKLKALGWQPRYASWREGFRTLS
jgi:nucleoside-diphosphate-sugar epimerase